MPVKLEVGEGYSIHLIHNRVSTELKAYSDGSISSYVPRFWHSDSPTKVMEVWECRFHKSAGNQMLYFLMETALGGDLYSVYVKNALHGNLPA